MTFNPNIHLIQLKSKEGTKDYLPVQYRLVWFREACPQGTIDTEEICVDLDRDVEAEVYVWNNEKRRSEKVIKHAKGYARYKAVVTDGLGGRATGHGSENAADFLDFSEKAETKAIGRALAALGYGTQFAPELSELPRIVDSPVERERDNSERAQAEQNNKTPWQASPAVAPSYARTDIPQPRQLREQCERLYPGQWVEVITRLLGNVVADDELTPGQCASISAKLTRVEKSRQTAPIVAAEQAAS